jgi:hypothetical protein
MLTLRLFIKIFLIGSIVVGAGELAKKSTLLSAIFISLPLTSITALIWLYHDTGSVEQIRSLSIAIFWMVLPSLAFFIYLSLLLKSGVKFYPSIGISCVGMAITYALYSGIIKNFGIEL